MLVVAKQLRVGGEHGALVEAGQRGSAELRFVLVGQGRIVVGKLVVEGKLGDILLVGGSMGLGVVHRLGVVGIGLGNLEVDIEEDIEEHIVGEGIREVHRIEVDHIVVASLDNIGEADRIEVVGFDIDARLWLLWSLLLNIRETLVQLLGNQVNNQLRNENPFK